MSYESWRAEVAQILGYDEPLHLEEDYPQLRPLLYDARLSPVEAANALREQL